MPIVGCGSGRCGTQSLARILDSCDYVHCGHETEPKLYWDDDCNYQDKLEWFKQRKNDVALYYGKYIDRFLDDLEDIKVICMVRDKKKTVESFKAVTPDRNHWSHEVDEEWDKCFPSYDFESKANAIRQYWEDYYDQIPDEDPRVMMMATEWLNEKQKLTRLFDFCEIPKKDRVFPDKVKYNKREKHVGYRNNT
jgi:hypothetical protein